MERQTQATEENAKAAKQSADAFMIGERAWMVAEMEPLPDNRPEVTYRMVCRVKNMGKTPAHLTAKGEQSDVGDRSFRPPDDPPIYGSLIRWENEAILPPGAGMDTLLYLTANQALPVYIGEKSLWVHGFVEYKDSFGNPHETRYCFRYYPRLGGKDVATVGFFPDGPAAYNKAT